MLYHLAEWLKSLGLEIPGLGLMSFLSFRAMLALVLGMLISFISGGRIIRCAGTRLARPYATSASRGRCRRRVPRLWAESLSYWR